MKHFFFAILLFVSSPMFASGQSNTNTSTDQTGKSQSVSINPIFESATAESEDMSSAEDGALYHVSRKPLLSLRDFTDARVVGSSGSSTLELGLTKIGGTKIKDYSAKNVGKKLAFIVDGQLMKAPKIRVPIGGKGLAIDPLDRGVADRLAKLINSKN